MKVLSSEQMRLADERAIAVGIPSLVLMENAAHRVLEFIPSAEPFVAIFCGKGNNGGDGLALARLVHLTRRPKRLEVIVSDTPVGDAAVQLRMLRALHIPVTEQPPDDIHGATLIVDALLGTGTKGEPHGITALFIELINSVPNARRISIDVPSGLGSATTVRADVTITFAAPKPLHILPPTCEQVGELHVAPIGIPAEFLEDATLNLISPADLAPILTKRPLASHKGDFGHIAILGGALGKHGALQMAGAAAIGSGAGLVSLYSPDTSFHPQLPDLMLGEWLSLHKDLQGKSVVAIGPGLGSSPEGAELTRALFHHWPAPMVLDADALNNLAPLVEAHASSALRVLSPHPGEMKRLLNRDIEDRIEDSRGLAARANSVVILKGQRSLVAFPDGQVWVNPTGCPALAKGGSGDVLTGLLASLLSQHPEEQTLAILAAVFLHGLCGEIAAQQGHERCSLASRLLDYLPKALQSIQPV